MKRRDFLKRAGTAIAGISGLTAGERVKPPEAVVEPKKTCEPAAGTNDVLEEFLREAMWLKTISLNDKDIVAAVNDELWDRIVHEVDQRVVSVAGDFDKIPYVHGVPVIRYNEEIRDFVIAHTENGSKIPLYDFFTWKYYKDSFKANGITSRFVSIRRKA